MEVLLRDGSECTLRLITIFFWFLPPQQKEEKAWWNRFLICGHHPSLRHIKFSSLNRMLDGYLNGCHSMQIFHHWDVASRLSPKLCSMLKYNWSFSSACVSATIFFRYLLLVRLETVVFKPSNQYHLCICAIDRAHFASFLPFFILFYLFVPCHITVASCSVLQNDKRKKNEKKKTKTKLAVKPSSVMFSCEQFSIDI